MARKITGRIQDLSPKQKNSLWQDTSGLLCLRRFSFAGLYTSQIILLPENSKLSAWQNFPAITENSTVLIVPQQDILVKNISVPGTSAEEARNAAAFRLAEEIPYALDEICYTTAGCLPKSDGNYEVTVFWCRKENIQNRLDQIAAAKKSPDYVLTSAEALHGYFKHLLSLFPNLASWQRIILVHTLPQSLELVVLQNNELIGAKTLRSSGCEENGQEIKNMLHNLRKERSFVPDILLLSGDQAESLLPPLQAATGIPCQTAPLSPLLKKEWAVSSAVLLLGGLLLNKQPGDDLSPPEYRAWLAAKEAETGLSALLTLCALILGICLLSASITIAQKNYRLNKLGKHLEQIRAKNGDAARQAEELLFLEQFNKNKKIPPAFLASLTDLLPADMALTRLEYDEEDGFRMRGYSTNNEKISGFLQELKKLDYITAAELDFSSRKRQGTQDLFEFQISIKIQP